MSDAVEVKLLCTGEGCPLRSECVHWDQNNDCAPGCIGEAYFIAPPWDDGFCEAYRQHRRKT